MNQDTPIRHLMVYEVDRQSSGFCDLRPQGVFLGFRLIVQPHAHTEMYTCTLSNSEPALQSA